MSTHIMFVLSETFFLSVLSEQHDAKRKILKVKKQIYINRERKRKREHLYKEI